MVHSYFLDFANTIKTANQNEQFYINTPELQTEFIDFMYITIFKKYIA